MLISVVFDAASVLVFQEIFNKQLCVILALDFSKHLCRLSLSVVKTLLMFEPSILYIKILDDVSVQLCLNLTFVAVCVPNKETFDLVIYFILFYFFYQKEDHELAVNIAFEQKVSLRQRFPISILKNPKTDKALKIII